MRENSLSAEIMLYVKKECKKGKKTNKQQKKQQQLVYKINYLLIAKLAIRYAAI